MWTYAGVRPLYDDGASEAKAATREYVFELDTPGGAPLLSIYGGKITTYRRLAEEALERLAPYLRSSKAREGWTAKSPLPGGDLDVSAIAALTAELVRGYPFLVAGACQPAGACLRHARQQAARQCEIDGRSRPVVRRHLDGKRSQVPDVGRSGPAPLRISCGGDPSLDCDCRLPKLLPSTTGSPRIGFRSERSLLEAGGRT